MSFMRQRASKSTVPYVIGLVALLGIYQFLGWIVRHEPRRPPPHLFGVFYHGDVPGVDPREAPPLLRVDPDVRREWPRDGFGFRLHLSSGFMVDTFSGQVAKGMGMDPDTTIALVIEEKELDWIYEMALAARFYEVPEPHPPYDAAGFVFKDFEMLHYDIATLTVRFGDMEKNLQWNTGFLVGPGSIEQWRRLWWVAEQMRDAVVFRPEYRALPKGRPYLLL